MKYFTNLCLPLARLEQKQIYSFFFLVLYTVCSFLKKEKKKRLSEVNITDQSASLNKSPLDMPPGNNNP